MTDEKPTAADPPLLSFRMRVIAGLRERGWPESRVREDDGMLCWPAEDVMQVWVNPSAFTFGYLSDDGETADGLIAGEPTPERVVEAIDRLRWVIAVPARVGEGNLAGCLPPLIPPEGAQEALAEARALMGPEIDDLLRRTGVLDPDGPPSVPLRSRPEPREDVAYVWSRWWIGE